jgi:hypothetical protein
MPSQPSLQACLKMMIELDGEDLRRSSIEYRKRKLVRRSELGIVLNA